MSAEILAKSDVNAIWRQDRAKEKRGILIASASTAAVFLLCLCVRYNAFSFDEKFVPVKYAKSLVLALRLLVSRITGGQLWHQRAELIAANGSVFYYGALAQLKMLLMSFLAGAGISLSGSIFQTAYRNVRASPNIIGATAGVSLGNVVVVMLFAENVYDNLLSRYIYCYGFTVACVMLVMLLRKLSGTKSTDGSLSELVMAGAVISQVISVFTQYFMYNLSDADLVTYQQITQGVYLQSDTTGTAVFFVIMTVTISPIILMRYRLNLLGLDKAETASAGLSGRALRLTAQLCGAVMVTCSMIHYGAVGMVSLVIPYAMRAAVGSDFRYLSVYSILCGGSLLMVCRTASSFFSIEGTPFPVAFAVEIALIPVFAIILARQRSSRNEA